MPKVSDSRIVNIQHVSSPQEILNEFPLTHRIASLVAQTRTRIGRILRGDDRRLLVIAGPCSIHDVNAAKDYAKKLMTLRHAYQDTLEIVMRVYFEKPRTTVGWKGLINDPDLDESFHINKGLRLARNLLVDLNEIGLPTGTEFLDIVTGQYYADLISWGAIGARTTESQVHRELASGLSCPVGFKNGTDGNIDIAVDAIKSANNPHIFLSPTQQGSTAIYTTSGNENAHLILRGGKQPNYDNQSVQNCVDKLTQRDITTGLIIDFSHANSFKQFTQQIHVAKDVGKQIKKGNPCISGVMIESHLIEGRQDVVKGKPLQYGQSITDGCIGWEATEHMLNFLSDCTSKRI